MIRHQNPPKNNIPPLEGKKRKVYHKPQLEQLGDLRTLTLGGTNPISLDSGEGMGDYVRT